jgi:tRNA (Thr-GGU) A37 N-methylase
MVALEEFNADPIGHVSASSFNEKWGTPRQGALAPLATITISLKEGKSMQYSGRVAVLWLAHLNATSFNHLKAHIRPPKKLDGPVGVFATRGVHRPSSVGLTFCDVVSQQGHVIVLRGADMIKETPVLQILSLSDIMPGQAVQVRSPPWTKTKETKLNWSLSSFMSMQLACNGTESLHEMRCLIESVLKQDPRSHHSIRRHLNPIYEVQLTLGSGKSFWLIYRHADDEVVDILLVTNHRIVDEHRERSEGWLQRLIEKIPIIRSSSADG